MVRPENILKGWLSTLIGLAIICFTIYSFDKGTLADVTGMTIGCVVGLFLMWVRGREATALVKKLFNKLIDKI